MWIYFGVLYYCLHFWFGFLHWDSYKNVEYSSLVFQYINFSLILSCFYFVFCSFGFFHYSTLLNQFSSVQFSHSVMSDSITSWTTALQASLSITNSWSLLKLMSTELVMPSNHLTLCHPLLLLPSVFPSIRIFYNKSAFCIRWAKYWNSSSPSSESSGLIFFGWTG